MNRIYYWGIGIFCILVISVTVYSVLKNQAGIRQMEIELAQLEKSRQTQNNPKESQQHIDLSQPSLEDDTHVQDDDPAAKTENILTEGTGGLSEKSPEQAVDSVIKTTTLETEKNGRESLFGLGKYPEVPLGLFPHGETVWDEIETLAEEDSSSAQSTELMVRVRIKLWELGTETVGASMSNGLIYPSISNVAYVTYGTRETKKGEKVPYIQRLTGGGDLTAEEYDIVEAGGTPSGWTILSHANGGVAPYTFLELE